MAIAVPALGAGDPPAAPPQAGPNSPLSRALGDPANPKVHAVGPDRPLKLPSDAARVVRNGDVVEIDPGTYEDCAVWRANGLKLRGKGGVAHIANKSCQGKGLWVIDGDNATVENMRFTGAAVPDKNGAGIRLTGGSLTVRNSAFEDNENGILAGAAPGKTITIEASRFERNGKCDPVCAHGIYVNQVDRLVVQDSVFREQRIGHHIKSRARNTVIVGNTIEDGDRGTASYLIDLPDAGDALIARNRLQKGRRSDNTSIAIAYGQESQNNPGTTVRIEDNQYRSDLPNPASFVFNNTKLAVVLSGNMLCGQVTPLTGPGEVRGTKPCK